MSLNLNRSFGCKNEELPVVCGFVAISLARDLSDFASYSPMFDASYLAAFNAKIGVVQELVEPKSETVEHKVITDRMYKILDDLISPINFLEGYLKLAGNQVPISSADFGLVQLRKSIRSRDVENALILLQRVGENIKKFRDALVAKGLTDVLAAKFTDTATSLADCKNKRFALISSRAAMVQNNMGLLNDLNDQLSEICKIGKILYKQTDHAKLNDYTVSQMMKQVARSVKPSPAKKAVAEPA